MQHTQACCRVCFFRRFALCANHGSRPRPRADEALLCLCVSAIVCYVDLYLPILFRVYDCFSVYFFFIFRPPPPGYQRVVPRHLSAPSYYRGVYFWDKNKIKVKKIFCLTHPPAQSKQKAPSKFHLARNGGGLY